jgi:hypothetical protein
LSKQNIKAMAATIYSVPQGIMVPKFNIENISQYEKDCELFLRQLKVFARNRNKGKLVGEIIRFQVADGYAEYMVAGLRPVELIHIPLWDAYQFAQIHLMTANEIKQQIEREKAFQKSLK